MKDKRTTRIVVDGIVMDIDDVVPKTEGMHQVSNKGTKPSKPLLPPTDEAEDDERPLTKP